jgi:hypothetical protein
MVLADVEQAKGMVYRIQVTQGNDEYRNDRHIVTKKTNGRFSSDTQQNKTKTSCRKMINPETPVEKATMKRALKLR